MGDGGAPPVLNVSSTDIIDGERKSSVIDIEENARHWRLDQFCFPKQYQGFVDEVIIPHGLVKDRIERLAHDIVVEVFGLGPYASPPSSPASFMTADSCPRLHVLCILKGGYKFFSDLMEVVNHLIRSLGLLASVSVDFIRVKSYENDKSTGNVKIIGGDVLEDIKGKTVLIVEDLIDTGRTMEALLRTLREYQPKRLLVACLLLKNSEERVSGRLTYVPDFLGFKVPNKFIVGYAIDYNEFFRDLHHICIVNDRGKEYFRV